MKNKPPCSFYLRLRQRLFGQLVLHSAEAPLWGNTIKDKRA